MQYTILTATTNTINQDKAEVFQIHQELIFVLADGAGGIGGGAEAAQAVIDNLKESVWVDYVSIFRKIDNAIAVNPNAGETTAICIKLKDNLLSGVSVGDTEAWLVKKNEVIFLTENQFHKPLLGTGMAIPVKFEHIVFSGTLLLASDGLTKYTSVENIISIIRQSTDLSECAKDLIELVRYPSGTLPDDTTVILCKQ